MTIWKEMSFNKYKRLNDKDRLYYETYGHKKKKQYGHKEKNNKYPYYDVIDIIIKLENEQNEAITR